MDAHVRIAQHLGTPESFKDLLALPGIENDWVDFLIVTRITKDTPATWSAEHLAKPWLPWVMGR